MLTVEQLKEMEPGKIFASGVAIDSFEELNMTGSGKLLRWIAKRGNIHDWCIYVHWADKSFEFIASQGDKVVHENHIKKFVPCSEEAFKLYRY